MAWTKHWKVVTDGSRSPISGESQPTSYLGDQANAAFRNYQSMLPDVYSGHPNRVDRYMQYENMDLDSAGVLGVHGQRRRQHHHERDHHGRRPDARGG